MRLLIVFLILFSVGAMAAPDSKNFFKDKTTIENPFNLRDPFKAPQFKSEKSGRGFSVTGKGQYSNIQETNFGQIEISDIKVVGVLIGKERRAMIEIDKSNKASDSGSSQSTSVPFMSTPTAPATQTQSSSGSKSVLVVKEGMKIGTEGAELKAILPGGIVLVEKIVNVYGEEEYLETVIPISR